jgi:hypothetical protein
MIDQKKTGENALAGKFMANALYVLTVLLILGFFIQSITPFVLMG